MQERLSLLSSMQIGESGTIGRIEAERANLVGIKAVELERRLLESGFVEGAKVRITHLGPIGGDPMIVQLDDARIAIRRCEAQAVWIYI